MRPCAAALIVEGIAAAGLLLVKLWLTCRRFVCHFSTFDDLRLPEVFQSWNLFLLESWLMDLVQFLT